MKHEYHEGPEALERFEKGMKKLFQAPKVAQWAYRELLARAFSPPNLSWRDALGRCPRLV